MSIHEFNCSKCGQKTIPIKIEHSPGRAIYIIILKCPNHKIKFKIQENDMKNYIPDIVKSTLICPKCKSTGHDVQDAGTLYSGGGRSSDFRSYFYLYKYCTNCGKKTRYEFVNILFTQYYNQYFDILKSQENLRILDINRKALMCPECNEYIIARRVKIKSAKNKNLMINIKGKCSGPTHHPMELNLPIIYQYSWLSLLQETINKCEKCNSTDLFTREINFKLEVTSLLGGREIIQICKKCGFKNIKLISYHNYEIYRRLLKEKEIRYSEKKPLFCLECGSEALLERLILKRNEIQAILFCRRNHKTKKILAQNEKSLWIDSILFGINKCAKCWSPNQRVRKINPEQSWNTMKYTKTEIILQCLDCKKKRAIEINNIIFDDVMDYLFK